MVSRRNFMGLLASSSIGMLAGCPKPPNTPNDSPNENLDSTGSQYNDFTGELTGIKPDGEPPDIPNHEFCSDTGRSQHPVSVDLGKVKTGDYNDWELRVSQTTFSVGEAITIELQNTSSESRSFGNKAKYNIQVYSQQGWQEIRWLKNTVSYADDSRNIEPSGGIRWNFYMSPEGIIATNPHSEVLSVCPELPPGRYRFICGDIPVAVQFNIVN